MSLRRGQAIAALFAFAFALAAATACGGASSTTGVEAPPSVFDAGAVADGDAPADATGVDASGADDAGAFAVTSSAFVDQGALPVTFTCDGAGASPPLAWTTPPRGTVELALLATTLAKDGLKWNWVLHAVPPDVTSLAEGERGVGIAGLTSDGPNLAYSPPCSQGPGAKVYAFTVYALSARPTLPSSPNQVTGAVLTSALEGITLAKASISASYSR